MNNFLTSLLFSIRWPNLAIAAGTLLISHFFLMNPVCTQFEMTGCLSIWNLWVLIGSVLTIMAGGYLVNDLMDLEADEINDKTNNGALLLGQGKSQMAYALFTLLGIGLGIYLAYKVENWWLILIQPICALLLWMYSLYLKTLPLLGNLLMGILCALIPVLPMIYALSDFNAALNGGFFSIYFVALFAFLITVLRELIKDMEDVEGDQFAGLMTLPLLFGDKISKWICTIFNAFTILLLVAWIRYIYVGHWIPSMYLMVGLLLPCLYLNYRIFKATNAADYHTLSMHYKGIMLVGLLYPMIYYFQP